MTNKTDEQKEVKVENKNIIEINLKHPVEIDGVLLNSVKLDFSNITGADVIKVDEEIRQEGHPTGFDNIWNHVALLKLASRASKMIPEDLLKLHAGDYMEVAFHTRNFFLKW